jgi:hypothetical protein
MQSGSAPLAADGSAKIVHLATALRMTIAESSDIWRTVNIPRTRERASNLRFAILDNNSIGARSEKRRRERSGQVHHHRPTARRHNPGFGVCFDPWTLPYDFFADPAAVELRSTAFKEYQRKNWHKVRHGATCRKENIRQDPDPAYGHLTEANVMDSGQSRRDGYHSIGQGGTREGPHER